MAETSKNHNFKTLVMFDTEATGLKSPGYKPRIIELCFIALLREELLTKSSEPRVLNKLCLCFNPRKRLSPEISDLTGLNNDALEAYGPFESQASLICSFLKSLPQPVCLIAHNGAGFDFPLLVSELSQANEELPLDILCADSLEAFRELNGLPRIQDFQLKRKLNKCSPVIKDKDGQAGEKVQCTEMRISAESLVLPECQESPNKQPKLSNNEWRIEEKTPERKTRQEDHSVNEHVKRQLILWGDSKSRYPEEGAVVQTCLSSDNQIDFSLNNVSTTGSNKNVTDTSESIKRNATKVSYRLSEVYKRCFGEDPPVSHSAESDCKTLLKVIHLNAVKLCNWFDQNAVQLTSIGAM